MGAVDLQDPVVQQMLWVVADAVLPVVAVFLAFLIGQTSGITYTRRSAGMVLVTLFAGLLWIAFGSLALGTWYYTHTRFHWLAGADIWIFGTISLAAVTLAFNKGLVGSRLKKTNASPMGMPTRKLRGEE